MASTGRRILDLATLAGLSLAALAVVGGHLFEGGKIQQIVQVGGGLIVFGGTCAAVVLQFPGSQLGHGLKGAMEALRPTVPDLEGVSQKLVEFSKIARREGLLSLDKAAAGIEDPFLRRALRLAVDGVEPTQIEEILEHEIHHAEEAAGEAAAVWEAAGGYAPTVGVLGAVMGLIHTMGHISDPEKVGAGIAVAFVATLYGVGAANLIFLPLGGKLRARGHQTVRYLKLTAEGVCAIAQGETPVVTQQRMAAMLGTAGADEDSAGKGGAGAKNAA